MQACTSFRAGGVPAPPPPPPAAPGTASSMQRCCARVRGAPALVPAMQQRQLQQQLLVQHGRRRLVHSVPCAGSAAAAGGLPSDAGQPGSGSSSASNGAVPPGSGSSSSAEKPKRTLLQQVKYFFVGDGLDKERLKALGMGAFASYGFVSNLNYGTAMSVAWLAFVKKYGVAPTAEGQWPVFLAFYAGLWAVQNFARPLRISLALALAPAFDRAITRIGTALGIDKKFAFGLFLLCMGTTTATVMFGSLYLLGGFPGGFPFPKPVAA